MSIINPGDKCVMLDAKGLPVVGIVSRASTGTVIEIQFRLVKLRKAGQWQLQFWQREEGRRAMPLSGDNAVTFEAKTKAEAEKLGRQIMAQNMKDWREEEARPNAFTDIPSHEQERWLDAWIHAHKSEWPNLFKVPKGKPYYNAVMADLIAMGFEEKATEAICKLVVKTKLSSADKLNAWLVANWFHGERLSRKTPEERLTLVRNSYGLSHATMGMVKQRLSRSLMLTHRNE